MCTSKSRNKHVAKISCKRYYKFVWPGSDAELFMVEPNLVRIKADQNYLVQSELIQTPIIIAAQLSSN